MALIEVWAPEAGQLEIESGVRRERMQRSEGGWWRIEADWMREGSEYAFRVDGGEALPDPRSRWQPQGVHGFSRWVEPSSFEWQDREWKPPSLSKGVIYELHVGTFTEEGSFGAVIEKLDHLIELGVSHIELMPVAQFPGSRGWGYDGVNLFAAHHDYGGPEGLKKLVDSCHQHGLAVILDVVYNHLGPEGNYLQHFGPYFTDRYTTPWGPAVNLDGPRSDEVRRFFVDNALMWLRDYHMDGLRIDAVHAFLDQSAVHFLEQLADEVEALSRETGRSFCLIAESDLNDPRIVRSKAQGGYGIDAQWNEDFHHALHALLTGERSGYYADFGSPSQLAAVLRKQFWLDGRYSRFRKRRHGRPADGLNGHSFVACLQNHDQTGNRALGERIGHLVTSDQLCLAAAFLLMGPFTPLLFQGEEWAAGSPFCYFTSFGDPELAEAIRRGRREEFAAFGHDVSELPDPENEDTFLASRLKWDEIAEETHRETLAWYRRLIALRQRDPALSNGIVDSLGHDDIEQWLWFRRGPYIIVGNFSSTNREIPMKGAAGMELCLASPAEPARRSASLLLPAYGVAILRDSQN